MKTKTCSRCGVVYQEPLEQNFRKCNCSLAPIEDINFKKATEEYLKNA